MNINNRNIRLVIQDIDTLPTPSTLLPIHSVVHTYELEMSQNIDDDYYYDEKDKREKTKTKDELESMQKQDLRIICSIRLIRDHQKTSSKSSMISTLLDQQRKNRDKKRAKATKSTSNNSYFKSSSSCVVLPLTVQSKIIYLLCSHRQNEYQQQEVTNQDLFMYTLASVSKTWRQLTAACLTSPWTIDLSRGKTLEEYNRFSRHNLSLLSSANHNIQFVIQDIDYTNTKYIAANSKWFREEVVNNNKVSGIQINDNLEFDYSQPEWTSLIERPIPTLKKFKISGFITYAPLDVFRETSTDEICRVLGSCHQLESLHLDLNNNERNNIDLGRVFSSIPRTITKLYFRSEQSTPYPFNLLPTTITDLIRPLVPPSIEVLELNYTFSDGIVGMESIFKYSGPLSNLHTLRLNTNVGNIHLLIPLIMSSSSSLKSIDFCNTFSSYGCYSDFKKEKRKHLEPLLEAIAKSPCIEKVAFRASDDFTFTGILERHLKRLNNKSLVLVIEKTTLFNINNYHYVLSSYQKIDYNK
ncbi:hypothetical protein DFA_07997 [Cavenderia fasciculata]|uniref:F-box domain-containing protein n=1 Tax=Cavenderia fasciculata TaxID=261658 RepID=F4Q4K7_CACFS|nr:uncharacterized protein DFA_07997 [Cavenderia fasciculata]EGG17016.1 hypothetical protein DFA_07997 [Cavenderia fasciculata]|eukprot:XP_004355500.1 hypothetical protein DFA_07997 [Cavenderia fasciculata]